MKLRVHADSTFAFVSVPSATIYQLYRGDNLMSLRDLGTAYVSSDSSHRASFVCIIIDKQASLEQDRNAQVQLIIDDATISQVQRYEETGKCSASSTQSHKITFR